MSPTTKTTKKTTAAKALPAPRKTTGAAAPDVTTEGAAAPASASGLNVGDHVVWRYVDTYAEREEDRDVEQVGQVAKVITDDDGTPRTARVVWADGGVSGPIALDDLERISEDEFVTRRLGD